MGVDVLSVVVGTLMGLKCLKRAGKWQECGYLANEMGCDLDMIWFLGCGLD